MTSVQGKPTRSVIAAGYLPLDIVSYQKRVWHAAGGTAGNVAAILGFLGWDAFVVADVGEDLAGFRVRRDLQKANVKTKYIRRVRGVNTPRLIHRIEPGGHGYRFSCPTCGQRFPTSRPLRIDRALELTAAIRQAPDVFFLDRLNAGTLLLAEYFHSNGSRVVFEPSRPSRPELLERIAPIAEVIKYADDRLVALDLQPARPRRAEIVTAGPQGARYRIDEGRWHQSPAFAYPVVDAGGAGDWTTAGLVHALPSGTDPLTVSALGDALRWAQALAAVSCGSPGARGLAKQQSVETVLRSATFLEQSKDPAKPVEGSTPARTTAPARVCNTCLLSNDGLARAAG
jgi:fructokinase